MTPHASILAAAAALLSAPPAAPGQVEAAVEAARDVRRAWDARDAAVRTLRVEYRSGLVNGRIAPAEPAAFFAAADAAWAAAGGGDPDVFDPDEFDPARFVRELWAAGRAPEPDRRRPAGPNPADEPRRFLLERRGEPDPVGGPAAGDPPDRTRLAVGGVFPVRLDVWDGDRAAVRRRPLYPGPGRRIELRPAGSRYAYRPDSDDFNVAQSPYHWQTYDAGALSRPGDPGRAGALAAADAAGASGHPGLPADRAWVINAGEFAAAVVDPGPGLLRTLAQYDPAKGRPDGEPPRRGFPSRFVRQYGTIEAPGVTAAGPDIDGAAGAVRFPRAGASLHFNAADGAPVSLRFWAVSKLAVNEELPAGAFAVAANTGDLLLDYRPDPEAPPAVTRVIGPHPDAAALAGPGTP